MSAEVDEPPPESRGKRPGRSVLTEQGEIWLIPSGPRFAGVALAVAIALAALITWAVASEAPRLMSFDQNVFQAVRDWADPLGWPVDVAHAIGEPTGGVESSITGCLVAVILLILGLPRAGMLLAFDVVLGAGLTELLKRTVARERPPGAEKYEHDMFESFPSGHSTAGIYVYVTIGLILLDLTRKGGAPWLRPLGWVLVIGGPAIGVSRVILGVHWPSDVLGGWAIGTSVLLTGALLFWPWPRQTAQTELLPGEGDLNAAPD